MYCESLANSPQSLQLSLKRGKPGMTRQARATAGKSGTPEVVQTQSGNKHTIELQV